MDERITIKVRRAILRAAKDVAEKEGVSLNQFIALALAEKVGSVKAAEFFAERGQGADAEREARWLEGRPEAG